MIKLIIIKVRQKNIIKGFPFRWMLPYYDEALVEIKLQIYNCPPLSGLLNIWETDCLSNRRQKTMNE